MGSICTQKVPRTQEGRSLRYFIPRAVGPAFVNQALGPARPPGWTSGFLWRPATLTILALWVLLGVLSTPSPQAPWLSPWALTACPAPRGPLFFSRALVGLAVTVQSLVLGSFI